MKLEEFFKKYDVKKSQYLIVGKVALINATPHPIIFQNGAKLEPHHSLPKILMAKPEEQEIKQLSQIKLVETVFRKNSLALELIRDAESVEDYTVLLISSIVSVNAYGYPVVSPISLNPRAPPEKRIVHLHKFNTKIP